MNFQQMVIFSLANGEYGIDISCVQEIIRIPAQIKKIPNVPSYVEGMINLRGKVIFIVDLKKRFQFADTERDADSRLLILGLEGLMMGIIVDDVSDVLRINEETIEGMCTEIKNISNNSIRGICKIGERLILLLEANKLKSELFQNMEYEMEDAG